MNIERYAAERVKQKSKFNKKARKIIVDMGDRWNSEERRRFVRSLVSDYDKLSDPDAEEFIDKNSDLIQNGR